jgi:hypothetical protein
MTQPIPEVSASKYRGLGDVVAVVAQPVAKALDAALGTDIQHCGGCQGRREWLNQAVPFQKGLDVPSGEE